MWMWMLCQTIGNERMPEEGGLLPQTIEEVEMGSIISRGGVMESVAVRVVDGRIV